MDINMLKFLGFLIFVFPGSIFLATIGWIFSS